jgi:hypothetical protein
MRKIAKKYKLENSELKSINSQWWDDWDDY